MAEVLSQQEQIWQALSNYLNQHFYRPDLEALRAVLAAVHSHYAPGDPVWIFTIAPPGSGKTAIIINCISGLPDVEVHSDLTPRSFLVGTEDSRKRSILNRPSLILAFKDFTTIVSKREEDQREISATLREVYDGSYRRQTASCDRIWRGKATVIAAVTPAIERAWAINRDLGERFDQVRWLNSDSPMRVAKAARAQQGKESQIAEAMRTLTEGLFEESEGVPPAYLPPHEGERLDACATLVAKLRRHVTRDSSTRNIIDVAVAEEPTRLSKSIHTVARHHAALFARAEVVPIDMRTAFRVIRDTVPSNRIRIVEAIPPDCHLTVTASDIREMTDLHRNTVLWQTDELEAVGVLKIGQNLSGDRTLAYTKDFQDLWLASGF